VEAGREGMGIEGGRWEERGRMFSLKRYSDRIVVLGMEEAGWASGGGSGLL